MAQPHHPLPRAATPLVPPLLLALLLLLLATACCARATSAASSQPRLPLSWTERLTSWAAHRRTLGAVTRGTLGDADKRTLGSVTSRTLGAVTSRTLGDAETRTLGAVGRRTLGSVPRRTAGPHTVLRRSLVEQPGSSRELGWRPQDGKYLLATCLTGGLSDQWQCLRKSFYLAGILNRTLLVPEKAVAVVNDMRLAPWEWATVVDFKRMRQCLEPQCGPNTVLLVSEYLKASGKDKVKVDYVHCAVPGAPGASPCFHMAPANALQDLAGGALELPRASKDTVFESPFSDGAPVGVDQVAKAFGGLGHEVLSLGDVREFKFEMPGGVVSDASPSEACVNVWRPNPAVMSFVEGILDTLLGSNYAAVYWKRGQENRQSPADDEPPKPNEVLPVTEVAARVRAALANSKVSVLYVATDARKAELATFESLLKDGSLGKRFAAILSLRAILVDEDWLLQQFWSKDAITIDKEQKNGVVLSLVDKFVCARAKFFVGTASSKFSNDVLEIRKAEGLANPPDVADTF